MSEKNDIIRAVTEALGTNGEGIVRHEGNVFFVPYCLPGEEVTFRVLKQKGGIGYGRVEEILTPAEERVCEKCPVFRRCGGCQLQHVDYPKQLVFKGKLVQDALKKIGGIEYDVPPAVASGKIYGYRNKLQLPIGVDREGNTVVGFYAERSHRIVPIDACPIHPEWAEKVISVVKRYASDCAVKGYDEEKRTGTLRHIVAREIDGAFIVTLVSATGELPRSDLLVKLFKETLGEVTLWLNINAAPTNKIFGNEFHLVHGRGFFEGEEQGIRYEAGPVTFLQVNKDVRNRLYRAAIEKVAATGNEVVVDAYSGGGLLTAMLAKRCKRVYGIELEAEAVKCADSLKAKNGLTNMTNICGAVEEKLDGVLAREKGETVRLILDPPRAGVARSVLKAILASGIERVVMISCNPATLARDLGILTGRLQEKDGVSGGELVKCDSPIGTHYELESVCAYDMFPQTKHVETLVVLSHKKPTVQST